MIYDEYLTPEEQRLIDTLQGKNRMEKDQILGEVESGKKGVRLAST